MFLPIIFILISFLRPPPPASSRLSSPFLPHLSSRPLPPLPCHQRQPFQLSAPPRPAIFAMVSCCLSQSFLSASSRCLASCLSLFSQLLRSVLVFHMPRTCKHFSSLSLTTHALQRSRKGPSTFENMPFLMQEHALLDARKACSRSILITI